MFLYISIIMHNISLSLLFALLLVNGGGGGSSYLDIEQYFELFVTEKRNGVDRESSGYSSPQSPKENGDSVLGIQTLGYGHRACITARRSLGLNNGL